MYKHVQNGSAAVAVYVLLQHGQSIDMEWDQRHFFH